MTGAITLSISGDRSYPPDSEQRSIKLLIVSDRTGKEQHPID
ncbi:hypothetical protein S7335_878 [Synechococcus sp. PCC 7335]|nr:hypothetical protein S7335_878 [Synechococcus sp. PCC 7335]